MAVFKKIEEIIAWQKARKAAKRVYELTSKDKFQADKGLRDQIRRSAISVMANIAEGHGRTSDKEFANFLNISHGSIAETQSHLYIALDLEYLSLTEFKEIYELFDEIGKITRGLMKHLRNS